MVHVVTSLCRLRQAEGCAVTKSICNDLVEILELQSLLLASDCLALRRAMGTVLYERWSHWLDGPGTNLMVSEWVQSPYPPLRSTLLESRRLSLVCFPGISVAVRFATGSSVRFALISEPSV